MVTKTPEKTANNEKSKQTTKKEINKEETKNTLIEEKKASQLKLQL